MIGQGQGPDFIYYFLDYYDYYNQQPHRNSGIKGKGKLIHLPKRLIKHLRRVIQIRI